MTHELTIQQRSDEESKKKKTITLKATTSALTEENSENSKNEEVEDNDMVLLACEFKKFFKKKGPPIRGKNSFKKPLDRMKEKENDKNERKERCSIFFGCNILRHLRIDYPLKNKCLRKRRKHCWLHGR